MDIDIYSLAIGGGIGFITSIASTIFYIYFNNTKNLPLIEISSKLIKSKTNKDKPSLTIKLLNKTTQDVSDIILEVKGFDNTSPKGSIPLLDFTALTRKEILYIAKFSKNDKDYHYAHQIRLSIDNDDIIKQASKYPFIRVSVKVSCPYHNTSSVTSKDYTKDDIINNKYIFNTGNSLSSQHI
jgi:hypothetical protein